MATQEINPAAVEEFAGRMVGILNDGFLNLALSIGHRTGLLDKLAELPPSTSGEIATASGYEERYVREWLSALTTGGIVDHDPAAGTFRLPPERAASITRAAGPDNLALFSTFMALFGKVEDQVVDAFSEGGGVPYSEYERFQAIQGEESARVYDMALVDGVVPIVPGLTERLGEGIDVLDLGCGQGHAINVLAAAFPASRCTGYDFSEEGVAAARVEAESKGLANARFEVRDVNRLDEPGSFDLITAFDVIHDLAHPRDALRGVAEALRPGGTFLMVDVAASSNLHENMEHPLGTGLYVVSLMHCMTVSLSQHGEGLGTMWGEQKARELLAEAGFEQVDVQRVEGDILNNYYVATKT
ncbi:MAG TPA: class I SAM-dependent methyltransferase [Thermoleophilaceae bacterium]|jgi:2-polyprenyl-3-methyl-5-hydroxy-6-metoxy-1,4-benzoquinol methylase|nr:class I SAM-dependent methyltransferase [Thermoleophilaceae bacterium]